MTRMARRQAPFTKHSTTSTANSTPKAMDQYASWEIMDVGLDRAFRNIRGRPRWPKHPKSLTPSSTRHASGSIQGRFASSFGKKTALTMEAPAARPASVVNTNKGNSEIMLIILA